MRPYYPENSGSPRGQNILNRSLSGIELGPLELNGEDLELLGLSTYYGCNVI